MQKELSATSVAGRNQPRRVGTAVVALTARGSAIAARLAASLPETTAYVPKRFMQAAAAAFQTPRSRPHQAVGSPEADEWAVVPAASTTADCLLPTASSYSGPVASLVAKLFTEAGGLVLVMAMGAAVRIVAPLLKDKRSDPAVVVLDDAGHFAISLLSGHLGGANRLAEEIAGVLGATPVITTASESAGVPSPDLLGRGHGWQVEPVAPLKAVAAALVNRDAVGVHQDAGERDWLSDLPDHVAVHSSLNALTASRPAAAILISDRIVALPGDLEGRTAIYRPPTLVLGIGCSRGATENEIAALVDETLAHHSLSPLSVYAVASLDRKADEPGLRVLTQQRGWAFVTYSASELIETGGEWAASEVVRRAVGVGGVAEPAALRCAEASELLVRKVKTPRVTLAIARRNRV